MGKNSGTTDTKYVARWWILLDDGRVRCELCPRFCQLRDGQRGFCFVRSAHEHRLYLDTYGRSSGFALDPIEKKPLNHFLPASAVLSFGTAGCNLNCRFCQNWDISKARENHRLTDRATPGEIAELALRSGAKSVAFTYNDPVIFAEYAIDTAVECHERDLKTVAVSAGYINPEPRREFFAVMDGVNLDLKGFTEDFYWHLTGAHLNSVLETIEYVANDTDCWVELTTLVIPGRNDSSAEIKALAVWIRDHIGTDVPLHFSAFHPDFKLRDVPPTSSETLQRARNIALDEGLHFVYTGNVHYREGDTTFCPGCGEKLVVRDWFQVSENRLETSSGAAACPRCGRVIPGVWS